MFRRTLQAVAVGDPADGATEAEDVEQREGIAGSTDPTCEPAGAAQGLTRRSAQHPDQ